MIFKNEAVLFRFFLKKKETTTTIKATYFQAKKKSLKFL